MDFPFIPAKYFKVGRIKPIQLIVIHDMEAPEKGDTAENVARYFQNPPAQASAHFCVDNNSVVQCVRVEDTAWHCKNANANGIGIEHAGYANQNFDQWLDDYGRAMLEVSGKLVATLCKQYNIPVQIARFGSATDPTVTALGLIGHKDVPLHGSHSDPGPNFPMDYYLGRVAFYAAQ